MALNIAHIEDLASRQVLTQSAQQVTFPLGVADKELIAAMKIKLEELGGVGLAAPQVHAARKIAAIYIPEEARLLREGVNELYPMHILINPVYEPVQDSAITYDFEGCYSVLSKAGKVPRYAQIRVTYQDEKGAFYDRIIEGFYARVVQHEVDHLNGTLITDRLTPECVQGTIAEMMQLRRAELPDEKKIIFDQAVAKKAQK